MSHKNVEVLLKMLYKQVLLQVNPSDLVVIHYIFYSYWGYSHLKHTIIELLRQTFSQN